MKTKNCNKRGVAVEGQLPKICPICQSDTKIGKLCGGKSPKYFCHNCCVEFTVSESKNYRIFAKVAYFTISGQSAGFEIFQFNKQTKEYHLK